MTRKPRRSRPPSAALAALALALVLPALAAAGEPNAASTRTTTGSSTSSSSSSRTSSSGSATSSSSSSSRTSIAGDTRSSSSSSGRTRIEGDRRSYRPGRPGHPYYPYYPHYPYYPGSSWYGGGWWWNGYWGWPWSVTVVSPRYPYPAYSSREPGALDTDVWPEEAEIWIDGERLGIADNFDGFPEYLWLDPGTYDLVLYHPGYRTVARQVTVRPGQLVSVDTRMERGEAVLPRDLPARSTVNRDDRLRRNAERREDAELRERDDWRDRDGRWQEDEEGVTIEVWPEEADEARRGGATLRMTIEPDDAAVYLDGELVGAAGQIADRDGIPVGPGEHRLEIVRPGYEPVVRTFSLEEGDALEIEVELERE